MQIVRRYGPEGLTRRIEVGHQRARDVILQVPLLSVAGWDGPVMLGEYSFDGRTAGVAHLTADYLPARPGDVGSGGRVDTATRLVEDGPSVMFPWDDHVQPPTVPAQPTGQLSVLIADEAFAADIWYRRGDWVCAINHGRFVTTLTARAVALGPLELTALDVLEPLLVERQAAYQRWASPPQ